MSHENSDGAWENDFIVLVSLFALWRIAFSVQTHDEGAPEGRGALFMEEFLFLHQADDFVKAQNIVGEGADFLCTEDVLAG